MAHKHARSAPLPGIAPAAIREFLPPSGISLSSASATMTRQSITGRSMGQPTGSLQLGVFRLGLLKDWDFRIGVFSEREEILVTSFCLRLVSRRCKRLAELQACHYSHGISENDAWVVEDFLELGSGFSIAVRSQISLPTYVRRVEVPEAAKPSAWYGQIVRRRDLQLFDGAGRIVMAQS
jgi:hypothetical protein